MDAEKLICVNEVLKDIYYKYISVLNPEKKKKIRIVEFIGKELIPLMRKKDELFASMFQGFHHRSSYINGTRMNNKYEFDLFLSMRLPLKNESVVDFIDDRCDPGYATCTIRGDLKDALASNVSDYAQEIKHQLLLKSTDGWKLGPGRTRQWIYSLALKLTNDSGLAKKFNAQGIESIRTKGLKTSGIATTLEIILDDATKIDVDIVPTFDFKCQQILHLDMIGKLLKPYWTSNLSKEYQEFADIAKYDRFTIYDATIPKPKQTMNKSQWRLDLIEMEKRILYENGCAKMVVELLECFRDGNPEIQQLSNYVLKTVVMLIIKEHPAYLWEEKFLAAYFLFALKTLSIKLEKRNLSFYFYPTSNIIDYVSSSSTQKMVFWLKKTLKILERSYDNKRLKEIWFQYFI